jgi:hypothetical protein
MIRVIGYAAHLRVYEPLSGLPDAERERWQDYVSNSDVPSRPVQMRREHEMALAAVMSVPPRLDLAVGNEHAYVRHLDGQTYICPWRLQVRAWDALETFRAQLPDELIEAFFPATATNAADLARDTWAEAHPDVHAGILTATWQVPVTWFVIFEADERRLVLGDRRSSTRSGTAGLDRALVYLTAMSRARRRSARALHVVRKVFGEGPATGMLEELGRWLEDFHPHSLVELDYGGLVHLLDDETLSGDSSVADIAESLERLSASEVEAAGRCYERVVTRWRSIAALEHAN